MPAVRWFCGWAARRACSFSFMDEPHWLPSQCQVPLYLIH